MQTTYNLRRGVAIAGMIADTGFGDTVSAAAKGSVQAGVFVARTGDYSQFVQGGQVKAIDTDTDARDVAGVSLYLATKADTSTFADTETVPVRQRGRIWVRIVDGTEIADFASGVYVSTASATAGWLTDPNEANALRVYGVRVLAIEEGIALVDVNLPATVPDPIPEP